ncbi:SMC5-SMC6 complex localization factor protein 1 isoform X4 [Narcine bancroftii]
MIANKPNQSEKFLAACAAGKWVLSKDYIHDSVKYGRWLNEIQYEWGSKIQSNLQLPVQMDCAPKIWREELARSGKPGVFHNWKVVLLINDEARKGIFRRVLHAGKATVYRHPRRSCEITHVLTESRNYTIERLKNAYNAPYYPVEYIGQFILKPLCYKMSNQDINFADVDHMKSQSFKDSTVDDAQILQPSYLNKKNVKSETSSVFKWNSPIDTVKHRLRLCLSSPEAIRSKYVPSGVACCLQSSAVRQQMRVVFTGVAINRIEGILEGQFYMEALKEMRFHLSSKFFPPAYLLQSFLQQILEGNVGMGYLQEFICIMQSIILNPPWSQSSMMNYYMEVLQCSTCKRGSSSLFVSLARLCVYGEEPCHQPSNQELSILELKSLYKLILKCYFDIFEAELETLNKSCYQNTNSGDSLVSPFSVLAKMFLEYSGALSNPVSVLLDCVLQATKALVKKPNDKAFCETAYIMHGILGIVVEYRLLLNRLSGKSLSGHTWDDLQVYIPICCQDFSQEEIEMMLKLTPSPWLQMFITLGLYQQTCFKNGIEIFEKSFSLKQIISSYLTALERLGSCLNVIKDPKGKKMGQWPWHEPLRQSVTLTGGIKKQLESDIPLSTKMINRQEATTGSNKRKELRGTTLVQDYHGRRPINCINSPKSKKYICASYEDEKEDNKGLPGNFENEIKPTEFESGAYLWSMLLKNYIENHNLSFIFHVMNDESLNTVEVRGKNLFNSFPDHLILQYAEDLKAYKELPKCIQHVLGKIGNGALALGVHTELLLLHLESTLTHF